MVERPFHLLAQGRAATVAVALLVATAGCMGRQYICPASDPGVALWATVPGTWNETTRTTAVAALVSQGYNVTASNPDAVNAHVEAPGGLLLKAMSLRPYPNGTIAYEFDFYQRSDPASQEPWEPASRTEQETRLVQQAKEALNGTWASMAETGWPLVQPVDIRFPTIVC